MRVQRYIGQNDSELVIGFAFSIRKKYVQEMKTICTCVSVALTLTVLLVTGVAIGLVF